MQITDTIADLLTRIRNASSAKHDSVEIPASNMKKAICQILVDEGYVKNYTVTEDGKQGVIKVTLKYGEGKTPVIQGLRRVSKPAVSAYFMGERRPASIFSGSITCTRAASLMAGSYRQIPTQEPSA